MRKIVLFTLLISSLHSRAVEYLKPLFTTTFEIVSKPKSQVIVNNKWTPFYNSAISFYDGIQFNLWATIWYKKFIVGFGIGTLNTGFINNYFSDSGKLQSSRLNIGLKLESPIPILFSNKYEASEDFENYYFENENEKNLHITPYLGLNLFYLLLLEPRIKAESNYTYNNNTSPSFVIQPYFKFSIKNKSVEYVSLTLKYAFGITNAEKLTMVNETSLSQVYYSTNSYVEFGLSKNINFYFRSKLRSPGLKKKVKYRGQCPD